MIPARDRKQMMTIKSLSKQILPPIVVAGMRRLARLWRKDVPEWEYVPEGWFCSSSRITGWNVESIANAEKAKWQTFQELTRGPGTLGIGHEAATPTNADPAVHNTIISFAYVLVRAARGKDCISILDWGGGLGHYYLIARAVAPEVALDYHCKDLPHMCRTGRQLLPEITFHEDEQECWDLSFDLVLASSSLHYSEAWKATLRHLASVSKRYLYVTRLPVVLNSPSFVVVQRPYKIGYAAEYLGWSLNRQEFLGEAATLGMELVREFLIQDEPKVSNAPEQVVHRGFLFRPDRKPPLGEPLS